MSWYDDGDEIAQVIVDEREGRAVEVWTGPQVAWQMARGLTGAFGRKVNSPWVWIPLMVAFFVPFFDRRRPFRLLHLDLLVLLSFSLSHVFFNRGEIYTSVPLVYPVLAYLLVRMLMLALAPRAAGTPRALPFTLVPGRLAGAGADLPGRLSRRAEPHELERDRRRLLGRDRRRPDHARRGPVRDVPRTTTARATRTGRSTTTRTCRSSWCFPWSGTWDDLPAAHAAAIAFDLATMLALFFVGRRLRAGPEGHSARARARVRVGRAIPYTLFVLNSNANDSLVALLVTRRVPRAVVATRARRGAGAGGRGQVRAARARAAVGVATTGAACATRSPSRSRSAP